MQGSVLFTVSGIHRGSWNVSPMDKGRLLYTTNLKCFFKALKYAIVMR